MRCTQYTIGRSESRVDHEGRVQAGDLLVRPSSDSNSDRPPPGGDDARRSCGGSGQTAIPTPMCEVRGRRAAAAAARVLLLDQQPAQGKAFWDVQKRTPSTARPLSRGPRALIGLPISVWTGACYWREVGGPIFNSLSSFGSSRSHFALFWSFWLAISEPGWTSRKIKCHLRQRTPRRRSAGVPPAFRTRSAGVPPAFRRRSAGVPPAFRRRSEPVSLPFRTRSAPVPHRCRTGAAPVPNRCRRRSEADPHGHPQTSRKAKQKLGVSPRPFWCFCALRGVFVFFGGCFCQKTPRRTSAGVPHAIRTVLRTCSALVPHLPRTCSALVCRTCAALVPHLCRTCAACCTLVPHLCRTCAALVPHLCRTCAALWADLRRGVF